MWERRAARGKVRWVGEWVAAVVRGSLRAGRCLRQAVGFRGARFECGDAGSWPQCSNVTASWVFDGGLSRSRRRAGTATHKEGVRRRCQDGCGGERLLVCATGVPLGRVPAGIWSLRGRVEPTSPVPPCCQRVVCGGRAALAILFSAQ